MAICSFLFFAVCSVQLSLWTRNASAATTAVCDAVGRAGALGRDELERIMDDSD